MYCNCVHKNWNRKFEKQKLTAFLNDLNAFLLYLSQCGHGEPFALFSRTPQHSIQAPRVKCAFYHKETESDYEEPT